MASTKDNLSSSAAGTFAAGTKQGRATAVPSRTERQTEALANAQREAKEAKTKATEANLRANALTVIVDHGVTEPLKRLRAQHMVVSAWEQGRMLPTLSQLNATMRVLQGDVQCALNLIEGVGVSAALLPALPTPEALAAVVLDSVAADRRQAETLLYQALRVLICNAPAPARRSAQSRRRVPPPRG